MALARGKINEIPHDAVLLNEEQALLYEWKIIQNWSTPEVWSLKYAPSMLGGMSALSGIYINNHYRRKLKLGNYGKLSTYLPIVAIPAMFSIIVHRLLVQRNIILSPFNECPLCAQVKAAMIQVSIGVVYPTILAPLSALMFATRHFTYRLPSLTENPMEVFKLWQKITKPIMPSLGAAIIGQSLVTMFLTYKQLDQHLRMQAKLRQIESSVDTG